MRSSHNFARVSWTFDDDHLVPHGGRALTGVLHQRLGVAELVDDQMAVAGVAGANGGAKVAMVIGAVLVGGDCIDDVDVLRAGATSEPFDEVRAPSTIGSWLRSFSWGGVRQLDAVSRTLLARVWQAGLGSDLEADLTIDVDCTVVETYGLAKQGGSRFSYLGVRGYHPLIASLADTGELLHSRLRGVTAAAGRGAATFIPETIGRVQTPGPPAGSPCGPTRAFMLARPCRHVGAPG